MPPAPFRALLLTAVIAACTPQVAPSPSPSVSPTATPVATPRFDPSSFQYALQLQGRIRVGIAEASPPFSTKDGATYRGFDADLARELAKAIYGAPAASDPDRFIQWVPVVSATRVSVLTDDKADVVVSTFAITEERKQLVDFSDPYFISGERVMVKTDAAARTIDDLAGKTVCTVRGSPNERTVVAKIEDVRLLSIDSWSTCADALEQGQADAVSADETVLLSLRRPDMRLLAGYLSEERIGVGVKTGRTSFVPFLNSVIGRLVAGGVWAELYKRNVTPLSGELRNDPHDPGRPSS